MPDFLPFRGTRYRDTSDSSSVVAPPYDVIDEEARAELAAADPHNSVRLILPRAAPPADPYQQAAATLDRWYDDGVLGVDPDAAFYVYRMRYADEQGTARRAVGVLGALGLDAEGVFPHEQTLPKARQDRLQLLRATRANLDPIWCLSLADDLGALLDVPDTPVTVATDGDGTEHTLVPVAASDRTARLRASVRAAPLVLADGHHRFETACAYAQEQPGDEPAAAIMTFVVPLDAAMLDVRAIHRLVDGAAPDLRSRLAAHADVVAAGPNVEEGVRALERRMRAEEALGFVDGDGLALVRLRPDARQAVERAFPRELWGVDAARFDAGVWPHLASRELSYRDDAATVAAIVAKGGADAAFLLRPVTVDEIRAAAFAGVRMPPKTTFFWPKPRTGMVFRRFVDQPGGGSVS